MKKETVEHKSSKSSQQALTEGTNKHQVAQKSEPLDKPLDISEGDERGVLDQVRDLLFGDQARDADQRMEAVEARLTTSIAQVRLEARDRIEILSKEMLERMDKIEERLSAVDRAVGALEKTKADRDALARLFSRMASRLEGDE